MSRTVVYDRTGRPLASLKCATERSWVLNGEGMCTISIAVNDNKIKKNLLEFGNFITIEHPKLPMWTGVLDTDRYWGRSKITLTAWSAERLFKFRRSTYGLPLSAASAGGLYKSLIAIANTDEDLRMREGDIWTGGTPRDETLDGKSIYDHIAAISGRTGYDWSVEGTFDNNNALYFKANWYQARGEMRGKQLKEGLNITASDDALIEQGVIVNDLLGLGDGSTEDTRISYSEINTASKAQYGLRQWTEDYSGNTVLSTLADNVRGFLAVSKNPIKTLNISAMDVGDTFYALRPGNVLPVYMKTVGFLTDGSVGMSISARILGMRYNDQSNRCELVLQEII